MSTDVLIEAHSAYRYLTILTASVYAIVVSGKTQDGAVLLMERMKELWVRVIRLYASTERSYETSMRRGRAGRKRV